MPAGELLGDSDINGSVFIGDKGMVTTGCYGERTRLVPAEKMKDYKLPAPVLTRSPGHYRDWIRACKGGEPSCSNFSVAGPFVQWMLLGVIAMRFEGKLMWDARKGPVHQQQGGEQLSEAEIPQGLEVLLSEVGRPFGAAAAFRRFSSCLRGQSPPPFRRSASSR